MKLWMKDSSPVTLKMENQMKHSSHSPKRKKTSKTLSKLLLQRQIRCFREEDCENLSSLMKNGISFRDALVLLDEERLHFCITSIDERLRKGEQIESFLVHYLPETYRTYFSVFIQYLPFLNALSSTKDIVVKERKSREELIKGLLYPVCLFTGTCVGILLFNGFIFPSMISLAKGFNVDVHGYELVRSFTAIAAVSGICGIVGFVFLSLLCLNRGMIVSTYRFALKHSSDNLLVKKASEEFARFFYSCHTQSISTRNTLQILMKLDRKPLVSYIARRLDWMMNEGKDMDFAMKNADVEEALVRFFHTAYYSSSLSEMMEGYLCMSEKRTQATIRKISLLVQLSAYCSVGVIVILVYRVLMLPVAMIGTF